MGILSRVFNRKYVPREPSGGVAVSFGRHALTVDSETAMTVAAFNRGVIYLATQMAKLPWNIKDADNNILNTSRMNVLLNRNPNTENDSFSMKVFIMIQAIVKGNGYWEIERDVTGRIKHLWPIIADDIQLHRNEEGKLYYWVVGGGIGGTNVVLWPDQVFHLKNFHSTDSLVGKSVSEYASETVGISKGANTFANSLYANSGLPSGVLKHPGKLGNDAKARLAEGWKKAVGGRKTGGMVILEENMEFSPITYAPDILQFIETRKFGVPEIARFLGVPPQKLYDLEQSTYNNVEQANLEVVTDTLGAWKSNIESQIDYKFYPNNLNRKADIDLFEVSMGDMDSRSQYYTRMMQVGGMTPNQIRMKEGMSPYENGDSYYIATNNYTPADRVNDVIDSQISKSSPEENSSENEVTEAVVNFLNKN